MFVSESKVTVEDAFDFDLGWQELIQGIRLFEHLRKWRFW